MKPFVYLVVGLIFAALFALPVVSYAGESPLGTGCSIASTSPTAASSASDSDCKWKGNQFLTMQCDAAVYYSKDGSTPTSSFPKIAVGDPYPIGCTLGDENVPIKVLAVSGTATCLVYRDYAHPCPR